MKTREEYLENGVEWVEFDNDRASAPASAPSTQAGPGASGVYDYDAECEAAAALHVAKLAPTVTLEDMPKDRAEFLRESLLRNAAKGLTEKDLADVSKRALALELRDPLLYWDKAFNDCIPILHRQVHALYARLGPEDADWPVSQLTMAADHINERTQSPTYMRGDKDTIDAFTAATFDRDSDYTADEKKVLLTHMVMHSRVSARFAKQLDKTAKTLGPEAQPIVDLIQEGGMAPEIMARADYLGTLPKEDLAVTLRREQAECLTAVEAGANELSDGHPADIAGQMLHDRVRLRACAKMVAQSAAARPESPDFMERHRKTNAALLQQFPLGAGHQVTMLSAEIARTRVEARDHMLDKLLGRKDAGAPEK